MPSNKALGPDLISDRWFKSKRNSLPLHNLIEHWVNENPLLPAWINNANLMLLSKLKDNPYPPVENTRPIAMSAVFRKFAESAWLRLYSKALWSTINTKQIGFRPGKQMSENSSKLLLDFRSGQYKSAWFIDIT
jgi:hypothetical protein